MGSLCDGSANEKGAPVYESHHLDSRKWEKVVPRKDDIIIATAYKSGTTWMQQIVAEILFQGKEKAGTVGDMSPWVDLRVPPMEFLAPVIEGQTHRRFLKTHLPQDAFAPYITSTAKYIYIGRDGRDAFMSLQNHYEKANDAWYGAMNSPGLVGPPLPCYSEAVASVPEWFDKWLSQGWETLPGEADGWPFWSLFKNTKTWWEFGRAHPDQVLFVHFNKLLEDLGGEMRRIAAFLEVPVDEALLPKMVAACTFDAMKGNADKIAPLNGTLWKGGGTDFVFKGTNGRWKGVLTDANLAAYDKKVAEELPKDCAVWLETGNLPP